MYKIFQDPLFYFMLFHFLVIVFLLAWNGKYLWEEVKKIDKKVLILLLLIFLVGFYFRNNEYNLGPHSDGYVFQESAHMWILHGDFVKSCAIGNQVDCNYFEQTLFYTGYPFLIVLIYLIFGINSIFASMISGILGSITILLVFFIAQLIFKNEKVSLYSALIFSTLPLNIINSQTALSRPSGLFFLSLGVLFYLLAVNKNKISLYILTSLIISYAIYIRPETYIIVPLLILFLIIFKWKKTKGIFLEFDIKKILLILGVGIVFLISQIPHLKWLLLKNIYNTYPGGGFYALHYKGIFIQGSALIEQFFNIPELFHYNPFISLVFLSALIFILLTRNKNYYFIVGIFLIYFIVYSLMFDGNIQDNGLLTYDYRRRSLMFHLAYAIVAGYGLYLLIPETKINKYFVNIFLVLLVIIPNLLILNKFSERFNISYNKFFPVTIFKDVRDIKILLHSNKYYSAIKKIPEDCFILTSAYLVPQNDYFNSYKRRSGSTDLIFPDTENIFFDEINNSNCAVYIEDNQCDVNKLNSDRYNCSFIKNRLKKEFLFSEEDLNVYSIKVVE